MVEFLSYLYDNGRRFGVITTAPSDLCNFIHVPGVPCPDQPSAHPKWWKRHIIPDLHHVMLWSGIQTVYCSISIPWTIHVSILNCYPIRLQSCWLFFQGKGWVPSMHLGCLSYNWQLTWQYSTWVPPCQSTPDHAGLILLLCFTSTLIDVGCVLFKPSGIVMQRTRLAQQIDEFLSHTASPIIRLPRIP